MAIIWSRCASGLVILSSYAMLSGPVAVAASPSPTAMTSRAIRAFASPSGPTARSQGGDLYSHGGPVTVVPAIYISWWGVEWTRGFTTGGYSSFQAQTYIRDFFGGIGGTRWNDVVTQYCDNVPKGTQDCSAVAGAVTITNQAGQLKGEWNDITLAPSAPSQTDIAKAAKRLAAHFGDPPGGVFLVFSPSGKSMPGFGTQYCAWHSDTQNLAYAYIPYMPDQGNCWRNSVNFTDNAYGNGWFDGFSRVAGHEYSEIETDPIYGHGWLDAQGQENADKCEYDGTADITIGSHIYAVQPTWSNVLAACTYA